MDKRGQELSTNAIIMIILGVVVLVVLIAGFYFGWGSIKDRIMGSKSNVDKISEACNLACSTNSAYDYCNMKRELTDEDGNKLQNVTCYMLSVDDIIKKFGIGECSQVDCKTIVKCADWKYADSSGIVDVKIAGSTQTGFGNIGTEYCSK